MTCFALSVECHFVGVVSLSLSFPLPFVFEHFGHRLCASIQGCNEERMKDKQ